MEGLGELSDGSRSGIGIGGRMQPMSRIQMDGIEAAGDGDVLYIDRERAHWLRG